MVDLREIASNRICCEAQVVRYRIPTPGSRNRDVCLEPAAAAAAGRVEGEPF